jgi:hypothetical protein
MDALDQRQLAVLVRTASGPATPARETLAALGLRRWPSGEDRLDVVGVRWLRRWGPHTVGTRPPRCECVRGRCAVCG